MLNFIRDFHNFINFFVLRNRKFEIQNQVHEKIRNDEDYDDWEYGTEPIYGEFPKKN